MDRQTDGWTFSVLPRCCRDQTWRATCVLDSFWDHGGDSWENMKVNLIWSFSGLKCLIGEYFEQPASLLKCKPSDRGNPISSILFWITWICVMFWYLAEFSSSVWGGLMWEVRSLGWAEAWVLFQRGILDIPGFLGEDVRVGEPGSENEKWVTAKAH